MSAVKAVAALLAGVVIGTAVPAVAHEANTPNPCSDVAGVSAYLTGRAAYYWFHWDQPLYAFPAFSDLPAARQADWEHAGIHAVWKACHPTQSAAWPETLPIHN